MGRRRHGCSAAAPWSTGGLAFPRVAGAHESPAVWPAAQRHHAARHRLAGSSRSTIPCGLSPSSSTAAILACWLQTALPVAIPRHLTAPPAAPLGRLLAGVLPLLPRVEAGAPPLPAPRPGREVAALGVTAVLVLLWPFLLLFAAQPHVKMWLQTLPLPPAAAKQAAAQARVAQRPPCPCRIRQMIPPLFV